ncbi:hypothetical protein F8M41_019921 [Gigaspora margarita]|uniref:Uncharacterized protein n=1 Tax=Gigaspora margarita TaxID=4874 RepID=A0A8H4B276_GIGMA|nr:hypothetical protein F8M41_019921 [Gigaspora margarita]
MRFSTKRMIASYEQSSSILNFLVWDPATIINLSERDASNPVNKLTESEKHLLKEIWNLLEASSKTKTISQNK